MKHSIIRGAAGGCFGGPETRLRYAKTIKA